MEMYAGELPALIAFTGGLNWTVGFLTTVAIFGILALGLNIQWGYTGTINFGVVAFFMVGAYTSAVLTLDPPREFESYVGGLELPVPVGWLGAMLAGALLALAVGLPTLRLRDDFLAIATIGIATILRSIANTQEGLVNRARGLNGIPRPLRDQATDAGLDYDWVLLAIAALALLAVYSVVHRATASPWGRVLRAIRENEGDGAVGRQADGELPRAELRARGRGDGARGRDLGAPHGHCRSGRVRQLLHVPSLDDAHRRRERQQPGRDFGRPRGGIRLVRHPARPGRTCPTCSGRGSSSCGRC